MKYLELDEIYERMPHLKGAVKHRHDSINDLLVAAFNAGIVEGLAQQIETEREEFGKD